MVEVTIAYLISFFLTSAVIMGSLFFWIKFIENKTREMERLKIKNDYETEMAYIRGYKKGFEDGMQGNKPRYNR